MTNLYLCRGESWYELWRTKPRYVAGKRDEDHHWSADGKTNAGYVSTFTVPAAQAMGFGVVELSPGECALVSISVEGA
jgi:hypothetical protein